MTDYTAMEGPEMLAALRDDASKWAKAFCQQAERLGHQGIDEGWMVGWFANAIEHSSEVRKGTGPMVLPDGSAFFIDNTEASSLQREKIRLMIERVRNRGNDE